MRACVTGRAVGHQGCDQCRAFIAASGSGDAAHRVAEPTAVDEPVNQEVST